MQLDAEENEDIFYKPPVEPAARSADKKPANEATQESQAAGDDDEDDD